MKFFSKRRREPAFKNSITTKQENKPYKSRKTVLVKSQSNYFSPNTEKGVKKGSGGYVE